MSSGAFDNSFYTSDSGAVYNIRVQPETLSFSAQGTPATAATAEPSAIANGSRRRIGVNARSVRLEWTATPPAGYKADSVVKVPILTLAAYTPIKKGDTVTYLGASARVLGKTPEYIN